MLEDRPLLHYALRAGSAFSLVFTAAMAGSAFMISGGFDLPDRGERTRAPDYAQYVVQERPFTDYAAREASYIPASARHDEALSDAPADAWPEDTYEPERLEGEVRVHEGGAVSEAQIRRDIEREYLAYLAREEEAIRAEQQAFYEDEYAPVDVAPIVDKQQAIGPLAVY